MRKSHLRPQPRITGSRNECSLCIHFSTVPSEVLFPVFEERGKGSPRQI
jgi:hypothetical protein